MSDHSGSRMLNSILGLFYREKLFDNLELEKRQKLIKEVLQIACWRHDCNSGEILDGYTDYFEICYSCLSSTPDLQEGLCQKCRGEGSSE
ncbi:hypothetical protein [Chroococcus sp. FPU101]|uniref:hypothetical protein n=1 Tax=Chroococcus sp. FPU101 TaxID=1974212 RepID=UPI001A8DE4EB|nr:hypothetical protein [Chroococcus sp. FPU101]GFE69174.1 hypothetical protein CFPU101_17840 [Chroococcus sp. FPU101]